MRKSQNNIRFFDLSQRYSYKRYSIFTQTLIKLLNIYTHICNAVMQDHRACNIFLTNVYIIDKYKISFGPKNVKKVTRRGETLYEGTETWKEKLSEEIYFFLI